MNSQRLQSSQCKSDPVVLSTVAAKTKKAARSSRLPLPSGGICRVAREDVWTSLRNCAFRKERPCQLLGRSRCTTHCLTLWVVCLCQVLSPNSTFFDQGCVRHPHVSIAFEKDKHRQENLCNEHSMRARVYVRFMIPSSFQILGSYWECSWDRKHRLLVCVCVCIDVCFHVRWQPLSQFSPSLKTLRAQSSLPPSAPEHRPCSRSLTGAEGKHQRHPDTRA